jgi:hypothetical protein
MESEFAIWRDVRDLDPTADFSVEIERAIAASAAIVVCVHGLDRVGFRRLRETRDPLRPGQGQTINPSRFFGTRPYGEIYPARSQG